MASNMRFVLLAALPLAAIVTLAARPAHAADRPRVAVLEIIIEGDAPAELRRQLDKSLAGGLYAAGYDVIPRDEVEKKLKHAPELVGCLTSTCLERVGELVGTRLFARARVSANGAAYTIELELLSADASTGPLARVERSCPVCTIDEANDLMSKAAAELKKGAGVGAPAKVAVRVTTTPPGATLSVDGVPLGQTPWEGQIDPGDHTLRASLEGRAPVEQQVQITPQQGGAAQALAIELPPAPIVEKPHPQPPPTRPQRFKTWKWVAAGGAVVGIVSGVWLLSLDGDQTGCPSDAHTKCKYSYDTAAGGTLLLIGGLAAGGASGWMFWQDSHTQRDLRVSATVGPGGAAAWAAFDW
jgi:hypothetical protein